MATFFRPTRLPIDPFGTPDTGYATMRVTSPYGVREDIRFSGFHGGLDIGNARLGDEVVAIGNGKVISATNQPVPPWNYAAPPDKVAVWGPSYGGNVIVIEHASGQWSQYAHLRDMLVSKGQQVTTNQLIGHVGDTGSAAPPPNGGGGHLHFGIRSQARLNNGHDGWVDPWPRIQPTGIYEDPAVIAELREKLAACRETVKRKDERIARMRLRIEQLQQELATSDPAQLQAALEEINAIADEALAEG